MPSLRIQIPSSPPPATHSPTPSPVPESAPAHPFAHSTARLELLPPSSAGPSGIDLEEETRLYDALRRTAQMELPPNNNTHTGLNHRQHPRRRRFSSPPPPSILSNDIFLADNTGRSTSGSSAFTQDVSISGWSCVGDAPPASAGVKKSLRAAAGGGGGAFIVFDCQITTKEGTTFHILRRYTAFAELDVALRQTLPRHLLPCVPPMPPKNPLARFRSAFLDRRRRQLQFWLASVLLHPEIGGTSVVKKWVTG